jgi:hypothetical protein
LCHQQDELHAWAVGCAVRAAVAVAAEAGLFGMPERGTVRIREPVDGIGQLRGLFCRRTLVSCAFVGRQNQNLSRIFCCRCMAPVDCSQAHLEPPGGSPSALKFSGILEKTGEDLGGRGWDGETA